MHNCILKSHLSVEHRENYSQNTVRKLFHKIFFQNFPFAQILFFFCPNFISPFPELPEILYAKTHISHSVPTSHNSTLPPPSPAFFSYISTVVRIPLLSTVACWLRRLAALIFPHPSPYASPLQKIPDAHHPAEHPRILRKKNPAPSSNAISRKKSRHLFRRPNNQNTQPTSPVCLRIKYVNSQSFPQVHFLSAVRIYYSKTTRR